MKDFNIVASDTRSIGSTVEPISSLFDSVRGGAVNDASFESEPSSPTFAGPAM